VLHNDACRVGTSLAAVSDWQAFGERRQEATDIGIAGAIGVHKLLLGQRQDGVFCDDSVDAHNGRLATLGDNDRALDSLCARDQGEACRDELQVGGLPSFCLGECCCLGLVAEEVIHHWQAFQNEGLERRHLHQERG